MGPGVPPLSVYVHLPWCVRRCPYCDFNSHEARGAPDFAAYTAAVLADLAEEIPAVAGREVGSVFFGGGTPSLCPPEEIGRILERVRAGLPAAPDLEVTLEANPGTVERGRFTDFAAAGVNRISLGVQTFQPGLLAAIGRIHDDRQALAALEELAAAGLSSFNIDLMYALPGQSVEQAVEDARQAVASGADHVSHYQLTLEPGTPFHRRPPPLPDEDQAEAMLEACAEVFADAGMTRYEVSAWARPGYECRHNLNYWEFGDYLGLGAGAHGKITLAGGRVIRRWKRRRPGAYTGDEGRLEGESVCRPGDLGFEFMLNALRLPRGFTWALLEERTGLGRASVARPVEEARAAGFLEVDDRGCRPTPTGQRFLNDLQALFLPEPGRHG